MHNDELKLQYKIGKSEVTRQRMSHYNRTGVSPLSKFIIDMIFHISQISEGIINKLDLSHSGAEKFIQDKLDAQRVSSGREFFINITMSQVYSIFKEYIKDSTAIHYI